jgi:hypothetical protein
MDIEELQIRMAMKTDEVKSGFERISHFFSGFKDELEEMGVHAESTGKTWKKVLHGIADASPLAAAALRAYFDPFVATLQLALAGFKSIHSGLKEFEKELDAAAERMAQPFAKVRDAILKAREAIAGKAVAVEERREQLERGKPGEAEKAALEERIEAARKAAAGDEAAFLREKQRLELEAKADADRRFAAAKEKEDALAREDLDIKRETRKDTRKEELQTLIKDQERLTKEIAKQDEVVADMEKREKQAGFQIRVGFEGATTTAEERDKAAALRADMERAETRRKQLEEASVAEVTNEKRRANAIKDAHEETDAAHQASQKLENDARTTGVALDRAEAEGRKKDLADRIALAKTEAGTHELLFAQRREALIHEARLEAEKNGHKEEAVELTKKEAEATNELRTATERQAREQAKFDRDMKLAQERRQQEINQPFMPTLKEIAGAAAWDPFMLIQAQAQRARDAMLTAGGMGFAAQHAKEAQELELTEADAKRAFMLEGPQSSRYKEDLKRIDTLKKGLQDAGLMKADNKLESIDNHIADLLDKASKEGLVVQPVNGA